MCHGDQLIELIVSAIAGEALTLMIVALALWVICNLWTSALSTIDEYHCENEYRQEKLRRQKWFLKEYQ